ncbi:hypothetical protein C2S51_003070 [Perilla frutescens var. frutescens]|nr:hypothetical protein C2S51_003070 [Perilla frutescens var. frutescens]
MPLYDCMLLLKPTVSREALMDLVVRVGKHVYRRNGVMTDVKSLGTVQLGYGIRKLDGRYYQGQLMQMTMMTPPSINSELSYLNKEDRLLRWLLIKHRGTKPEDEIGSELRDFRAVLHDGRCEKSDSWDFAITEIILFSFIQFSSHVLEREKVINHGIHDSVIEDALNVNAKFFEMPKAEKEELISDDIYKVARFGHLNVGDYSRDLLKLYAHPLEEFVSYWPTSPLDYRGKMGIYSTEARKLCIELFGAIMESLNIDQTHLKQDFEQGIQILGMNFYSPCSESGTKKIGIPPHTDHSIITLLLQSSPGLHVVDRVDGRWKSLAEVKGSLQVIVGDHLEVISNGFYKSVLHRAIPSCDSARLSIANLHSLAMDEIVEPAAELEREEKQRRYRGSSLRDFLKHLASRDARNFIETLKIDGVDS